MSKKRGVSLEEKRTRMLDVFYEKKDVFQLKELEKIGPAEKGVIAQSVKDVVQSLVDDGFVEQEKIGTSVYFWAFPGKATQIRKRKFQELEAKLNEINESNGEYENQLKKIKLNLGDSDEREKLMEQITELEAEKTDILQKLEAYKDSDPDIIAKEKKDTIDGLNSANRWTDNIFSIKNWIKNKFPMDDDTLNKQFNIPENFDYIDI